MLQGCNNADIKKPPGRRATAIAVVTLVDRLAVRARYYPGARSKQFSMTFSINTWVVYLVFSAGRTSCLHNSQLAGEAFFCSLPTPCHRTRLPNSCNSDMMRYGSNRLQSVRMSIYIRRR